MTNDLFDRLTDVYEALMNWPKRLAHETSFYKDLFERVNCRRVADVACGTGHHSAMFHSWGLHVEGSDISPEMIEHARGLHEDSPTLNWTVRSFDEPIVSAEPFDVAVCVGNSLALAPDMTVVDRVLREMLAAVREQGAAVVHVLNLWRLADGPCVWQKCKGTTVSQQDVLILKGVHRSGSRGFVELVVTPPEGGPTMETQSVPFLGIEAEDLDRLAREAGASDVEFYGGYHNEPYRRSKSVDLLMVARK